MVLCFVVLLPALTSFYVANISNQSGSLRDFLYTRIAKASYLKGAPVIDNLGKTNELLRQSFAIFALVKTIDDTIRDTISIIQSLGPTVTNVMLWFDMGKNCIPRAES